MIGAISRRILNVLGPHKAKPTLDFFLLPVSAYFHNFNQKITDTKLIHTVLHPTTNLNGRKIPTGYYVVSPETSDGVGNYLVKIGAIMISTESM